MGTLENIYFYEIDKYVNDVNAFIIDLRSRSEYNRSHIRGAVNIAAEDIEKNVCRIPRNKIIVVYCQSGGRSIVVSRYLSKNGFVVKNVIGGIKKYRGSSLT